MASPSIRAATARSASPPEGSLVQIFEVEVLILQSVNQFVNQHTLGVVPLDIVIKKNFFAHHRRRLPQPGRPWLAGSC
jgi:hypothetical protein